MNLNVICAQSTTNVAYLGLSPMQQPRNVRPRPARQRVPLPFATGESVLQLFVEGVHADARRAETLELRDVLGDLVDAFHLRGSQDEPAHSGHGGVAHCARRRTCSLRNPSR